MVPVRLITRRTLLVLAATTFPAAALAACGSTTTTATSTTSVAPRATSTTVSPSPAAPSSQKVTLQLLSVNTGLPGKVEKQQVQTFEQAHRGITVEEVPTSFSAIDQKLNTAIAAGTPPDIFTHGPAATAVYAAPKETTNLDPYIAQVKGLKSDFPQPVVAGGTWKGHVYQIQWLANANVLVYRKDFFTSAGLNPSTPPRTWQELATDGQKLAQWNGTAIKRIGYNQPTTSFAAQQQFFAMAYQAGSPLFNAGFTKALFNDDASIQALQFAHDLVYKYKTTSPTPITGEVPNVPLLVTGQIAMSWETPQAITYARQYNKDVAASLTDSTPFHNKRPGTPLGGLGLQITSLSKHKNELVRRSAWSLIAWFLDDQRMAGMAQASGSMPARTSSAENASWIKKDPILQTAVKAISIGVPNPTIPSWIQMRNTAVVPAVEIVLANKGNPKTALDTAVQKANALLEADAKKYGS
ncbi:MAG: ABC transporter substrate-binding protein [Chloroflexi bacterium]|nr:ABC transporter substrate-binding protein [Chloroflexota bacterium]